VKKRKFRISIAVFALLVGGSLSGCVSISDADVAAINAVDCEEISPESSSAVNAIAIVLSPTSNFTDVESAYSAVEDHVAPLIVGKSTTSLSGILTGGKSEPIWTAFINLESDVLGNLAEDEARRAVSKLAKFSSCKYSDGSFTPELDLLSGLQMASSGMSSSTGNKEIIVVSNGLQTAGDFRLQEDFESRPEDIVNTLKAEAALPNLNGIKISWLGLGATSGEQPPFSAKSLNQLENIWSDIITASGGDVEFKGSISLNDGNPTGPRVSVVSPLRMPPIVKNCLSTLTDENLTFNADAATFVNSDAASKTIGELAQAFSSQNCHGTVHIRGFTTNFGDSERQKKLSLDRANAVAKELRINLGGFQFDVEGMGYDGSGGLDASNRRVEVEILNQ